MADTYKIETRCTACGQVNDLATNVLLQDDGQPDKDSVLICSGCGHLMQFRAGQWVSLTGAEIRQYNRQNSKPWQVTMALQRKIRLEDPPARRRKFLKG